MGALQVTSHHFPLLSVLHELSVSPELLESVVPELSELMFDEMFELTEDELLDVTELDVTELDVTEFDVPDDCLESIELLAPPDPPALTVPDLDVIVAPAPWATS